MKIILLSMLIITGILSLGILFTYDSSNTAQAQTATEIGKNFNRDFLGVDNGSNVFKWTSHYDRIYDGNQWVNYILVDDSNNISYKSAGLSVKFDKTNCDYTFYDYNSPDQNIPVIENYKQELSVGNVKKINPLCNIISFVQDENHFSITVDRGNGMKSKTDFRADSHAGFETTYDIDNVEGKKSTFTITETCKNCIPEKIINEKLFNGLDNTRIDFGKYIYDTKNDKHGTLKSALSTNGNFEIKYEKEIDKNAKFKIDPTFSSANPRRDIELDDNDNDDNCELAPSAFQTVESAYVQVGKYTSAASFDCGIAWIDWYIDTIPDTSAVDDADIIFDTDAPTSPSNCDYTGIQGTRPINATDATTWNDVWTDTILVKNDATCTSTGGTNQNVDLGTNGTAYIEAQLTSNWAAIGIHEYDGMGTNTVNNVASFCPEEDACTPDWTLEVTYHEATPTAPQSFKTNTISTSKINLTWATPATCGAGGCTGYRIWSESPTGNGFTVYVANTTNQNLNYTSSGLTAGTQYNYKMAAYNHVGIGANTTASANYTITNAPTGLTTPAQSTSQINLRWTAPSGFVSGYRIDRESPTGGGFAVLVANTGSSAVTYSNNGLTIGTQYNYKVYGINSGGTSASSGTSANFTFGPMTTNILIPYNKTGDAVELNPTVKLVTGAPPPTITNMKVYRNGTIVNNTSYSQGISLGQTFPFYRTFSNILDSTKLYNFTIVVSIQNGTGTFTFRNNTLIDTIYTGNYITSAEGGYQINYTHSRSNNFNDLNLVVNRQSLPSNTECNFRDELFETGGWVNITNNGWFNQTVSVIPTQNVYVTCYNDELLFGFISFGQSNSTLAFVDYMNTLGTFAGVPISFLFIFLLAGLFTGRSAITGIIFLAITIGVMGTMGFFPDINGDPAIGIVTWGLVVFLTGIGVFVGKKYF